MNTQNDALWTYWSKAHGTLADAELLGWTSQEQCGAGIWRRALS